MARYASRVARPVELPRPARSAYVYVETLRPFLPPERDTLTTVHELGEVLLARTGYGFAGVVRDAERNALTPAWIDAADYAPRPASDGVAIAGSLAHTGFGLPTAFDLGARDGRNVLDWGIEDWGRAPRGLVFPAQQFFLGDYAEGWLEMAMIGGSVISLDVSGDGSTVALAEFWGASMHAISLADLATGTRRLLTVLPDVAVGVRFSPDGRWLLAGDCLLEAATGRHVLLGLPGAAAWWPAHSPSTLLVLDHGPLFEASPGEPILVAVDLSTGKHSAIGPIRLPDDPQLHAHQRFLSEPSVSPDGRHLLCGSRFGLPGGSLNPNAPTPRLTVVDLESRAVEAIEPPFPDADGLLERAHSRFRWLATDAPHDVVVADSLLEHLEPPVQDMPASAWEYMASNARDVVVYGLNAMLSDAPGRSDPHRFRVEVLRAISALRATDPERLEKLRPWLDGVKQDLLPLCVSNQLAPEIVDGWLKFIEALERIENPSRGPIDWRADRYLE